MFIFEHKKGFTLLELLIVISIIGILAAILLSYLNPARSKGTEANIKSNLTNARSQAALFYANSNTYAGLCAHSKIVSMIQKATSVTGLTPQAGAYANTDIGAWNIETCHSDVTRYAIWVPLRDTSSGTSIGWCVDNTDGGSRRVTVAGATGLAANALVCPP